VLDCSNGRACWRNKYGVRGLKVKKGCVVGFDWKAVVG